MGFDLHGLNPNGVKPDSPDWSREDNEEEKKAYFAWQENTPGAYFRANVWYYRPLWDLIIEHCDNILTVRDAKEGTVNNGYKIAKTKALKIAKKLDIVKKKGIIKKQCEERNKYLESLPLVICDLCNGTGTRIHEMKDIDCNACNTEKTRKENIPKGKKKNWQCNYPLDEDLIVEFMDFCKHSGGFEIW